MQLGWAWEDIEPGKPTRLQDLEDLLWTQTFGQQTRVNFAADYLAKRIG
jgi:hypothetical protein